MARVNVEQKALSDPRFDLLARLMKSDERDLALGRMVRVWNECIERGTYALPTWVIQTVFNCTEAPEWLVSCDLAERVGSETVRIKGTEGRVEYLSVKRATARQNGKLGGRPKRNQSVTDVGSAGLSKITSPAPAPAPAPALKENPIPPLLDTPEFRTSWKAWEAHRREIKKPLKPTMVSRQLKTLTAMGLERAIRCVEHTIEKGWTGLREPETNGQPQSTTASVRPATPFEMAHGRYNGQTGFERDAAGTIICDRLCKDLSCEHCKPRRGGGAS